MNIFFSLLFISVLVGFCVDGFVALSTLSATPSAERRSSFRGSSVLVSAENSAPEVDSTVSHGVVERRAFMRAGALIALPFIVPLKSAIAEAETTWTVVKSGSGPSPDVGELAAIRFKATHSGGVVLDDIFDTPEPFYTRVGSGSLLRGVETVLPKMRVGDRWILSVPGELAFGKKGRPSSAGKPRVPPDAEITFEIEMVGLPGKEPELIDIVGTV